ncbi:hypothetical protein ACWIG5_38900, partial [Streptomyces lydicus]
MSTAADTSAQPAATPDWRDRKRYMWLWGLFAPTGLFTIGIPVILALNALGWHRLAQVPFWLGPILVYVLIP